MPSQHNYDHVKNELLQAKLKIIELEKQIQEYKNLKKVSFDEEVKIEIKEVKSLK